MSGNAFKKKADNNKDVDFLEISKKWATLVGINDYEDTNIRNLHFCINDIKYLYEILINENIGNYEKENVTILSNIDDLKPTRNIILSKLNHMSRSASSEDSILFYFSGHGIVIEDIPYLLCTDTFNNTMRETAIPFSYIKDIMEKSLARVKILFIDACHSGALKGIKDSGLMSKAFYDSMFPAPEGFIVLTSCKLSEYSYEWEEKKQSVFSYFLVEGLKGDADFNDDGIISLMDTHKYTFEKVSKWAFSKGLEQTPTFEAKIAGDIIFVQSSIIITEELQVPEYEFLYSIVLIGMSREVQSNVENIQFNALGNLLNHYEFDELEKMNDSDYKFTDGTISVLEGFDPKIQTSAHYLRIQLDINKDNYDKIFNVYNSLEKVESWEILNFKLNKIINFTKLYKKCIENSFIIEKFEPGKEKQLLEFSTKAWADTITEFKNENNEATIKIMPFEGKSFVDNFSEVINPRNIMEFIKDMIEK